MQGRMIYTFGTREYGFNTFDRRFLAEVTVILMMVRYWGKADIEIP
jgi:hypothetical protein